MFCKKCGKEVENDEKFCGKCGTQTDEYTTDSNLPSTNDFNQREKSTRKDWLVLLLLSFFLGGFGVDRFYAGKIGTGILKLLTFSGCGIWWLIDEILICCGKFSDTDGKQIRADEKIHATVGLIAVIVVNVIYYIVYITVIYPYLMELLELIEQL